MPGVPPMHILIGHEKDDQFGYDYTAINLEFALVCSDKTIDTAMAGMEEMLDLQISQTIKRFDYDALIDNIASNEGSDLWKVYRTFSYEMARKQSPSFDLQYSTLEVA